MDHVSFRRPPLHLPDPAASRLSELTLSIRVTIVHSDHFTLATDNATPGHSYNDNKHSPLLYNLAVFTTTHIFNTDIRSDHSPATYQQELPRLSDIYLSANVTTFLPHETHKEDSEDVDSSKKALDARLQAHADGSPSRRERESDR